MLQSARILDLTWVLGGPFAGQLLAQLGAEVIKIEPLEGDPAREVPPYFVNDLSSFFMSVNRGKKGISLNLKSEDGLSAFYELVKQSDAVIYGFAPDVPERLGISFNQLKQVNPSIVVGQLIGLHDKDQYVRAPAYDLMVQALGGVMSITGSRDGEPVRVGYQIADLAGGLYLAQGVTAALYSAAKTGQGELVQVSLLDCQLSLLTWQAQNHFISGIEPKADGSRSPNIAPSEAFRCKDGRYIAVSPTGSKYWQEFCAAVGLPHLAFDDMFKERINRLRNVETLADILRPIFEQKSAKEWEDHFFAARVPVARVLTVSEALTQEVSKLRSMVEVDQDPLDGSDVKFLGNPFKFEGSRPLRYPPRHGEHTKEILTSLCDYDEQRLKELEDREAIRIGESK